MDTNIFKFYNKGYLRDTINVIQPKLENRFFMNLIFERVFKLQPMPPQWSSPTFTDLKSYESPQFHPIHLLLPDGTMQISAHEMAWHYISHNFWVEKSRSPGENRKFQKK